MFEPDEETFQDLTSVGPTTTTQDEPLIIKGKSWRCRLSDFITKVTDYIF